MLLGQEDHGIATGVAAAEKQKIDLARPAMKNQLVCIGHVWRCGFDLGNIAHKGLHGSLGIRKFLFQGSSQAGIVLRGDLLFKAVNEYRSGGARRGTEGFVVEDIEFLDGLPDIIRRHDLNFRPEDRISVGMIIVPMRIDNITDGLVCQKLYIRYESARCSRRSACIDDEDVTVVDNHNKVGAEKRIAAERKAGAVEFSCGVIDTVGNL